MRSKFLSLAWSFLAIGTIANFGFAAAAEGAQASTQTASQFHASFPGYRVRVIDKPPVGNVAGIEVYRFEQLIFRLPLVSSIDSASAHEHLSGIHYEARAHDEKNSPRYEIVATATSSIWSRREFHWRFYEDHLEFNQTAAGNGKLGRCYFFPNGISGRWDKGTSDGVAWNSTVMADHYWSPSPNHANQFEFSIAEPQTLGFGNGSLEGTEDDFRPSEMHIFTPPPLMLAFHRGGEWASVGIGAQPGQYRFPALLYSGSRYSGASWWVDYLGYQTRTEAPGSEFHSPVAAIHFASSALDALDHYTGWLRQNGFATSPTYPEVAWHHLPIFCGWAEQTSENAPYGRSANAAATQKNYETWIAELERRKLPVGTIVIDDKWQKGYGSFDVDREKWPDIKGFVAGQHARGRRVLLWVPAAGTDGLPDSLCAHNEHRECVAPDLGNPAYENYLRGQIRTLVENDEVDGFKEDGVWVPDEAGLPIHPEVAGIEAARNFQQILYTETHRWKPDALIETQTTNAAFRESSDVLRLNDLWFATRDVTGTMRERARIAHISGWELVDTDNEPTDSYWAELSAIWHRYIAALPADSVPVAMK